MNYATGSILRYRTFGGTERLVKVVRREPNIKNDCPGFDGEVIGGREDGLGVWGYDFQILEICS